MKRVLFAITKCCLALIGIATGMAALAQSTKLPNPADPSAVVPPARYESPFSDYRPYRDQNLRSWQEVNKEVADNPGMGAMGSMKHTPGMSMPGMDAKAADAAKSKEGAAGHDMRTMKDMPGMEKPKSEPGAAGHDMRTMKGMEKPAVTAPKGKQDTSGHDMRTMKGTEKPTATAPKNKEGAAGHDMGAMKGMAGMDKKSEPASTSKPGHDMMAMAKPPGHGGSVPTGVIMGSGVVQAIDKTNGRVQLTHDPIAALGWPKMTLFFRLKAPSLADQIKEGARVNFALEKSASGYVISSFQKATGESVDHKPHSKK